MFLSFLSVCRAAVADEQEGVRVSGVQARADRGSPGARRLHPAALAEALPPLPADRRGARLEGRPDLHRHQVSQCGTFPESGQPRTFTPRFNCPVRVLLCAENLWKVGQIFTATRSVSARHPE